MVSEQDIELLEEYLDGQLEDGAQAALETRLAADSALTAELSRLKQSRTLRMQFWQSCEGAEDVGERILAGLSARRQRRSWYMAILDHRERIAAAAACIAVFLIGWQWGRNAGSYRMVQTGAPTVQSVGLITQQQVPQGQTMMFEVRVNDASGKLVRVERFSTLQEAQNFIEAMKRQLQPRPASE